MRDDDLRRRLRATRDDPAARWHARTECVRAGRPALAGLERGDLVLVNDEVREEVTARQATLFGAARDEHATQRVTPRRWWGVVRRVEGERVRLEPIREWASAAVLAEHDLAPPLERVTLLAPAEPSLAALAPRDAVARIVLRADASVAAARGRGGPPSEWLARLRETGLV